MDEQLDREIPLVYDTYTRGLERICPDQIGLHGFRELVKKDFYQAECPIPYHIHPDAVELCYAYRGTQYYAVGQRVYTMQVGDVFLTYPNEPHSGGEYAQDKDSLLYYMIIDTVNGLDRFMGFGPEEGPVLAAQFAGLPRLFHAGNGLKHLLDEMFRVYQERPALAPLLMRSQFCLLVDWLSHATAKKRPPSQTDILRTLNAIEEQLPSVPKIGELAEMAHLSESYFKQKFRQEMGVPPAKYIMQRRIALSQRLLAEGMSVTETAFRLEFSSSQHFATYFKAYTLMTPSEWRRTRGVSGPGDV